AGHAPARAHQPPHDEAPPPDLPRHAAADADLGARDPLYNHPHTAPPPLMRSAECGMRNCRAEVDLGNSLRGSTVARSIPHSAFRIPHLIHHSPLPIPHFALSNVPLFARFRR